jgi:hypothetical protein
VHNPLKINGFSFALPSLNIPLRMLWREQQIAMVDSPRLLSCRHDNTDPFYKAIPFGDGFNLFASAIMTKQAPV